MKKTLKRGILSLTVIAVMMTAACGSSAQSTPGKSTETAQVSETAEELAAYDQLLEDVRGTYDELFTVICDPQYDQIWLDKCEAIVGADMAGQCADMLKGACTGTIYGEDAIAAYKDAESAQFDCYFINGVKQFVFDGHQISGIDENGKEVFSHEYAYAEDFSIGGMLDGYLYETADADAGEFRYFVMLPDTPASTYHIEFRYGSDKEALTEYAEGPYAYWLAAAIPADRDDAMIDNVIGLFAEENLAEMNEEEAASAETIEIGTAEELLAAECGGLIIGGSFGGTMENCTAKGTIIAEGNEPVGLGGIAGCLEMMDSVTDCTADVEIITEKGGHAIGGLCGYSGTHSVGDIALETEGVETHEYPGIIRNCHVTVKMNIPGATHVGGLVGTGLYYYGEETAFQVEDCSVNGEIAGAVTPGAVAGRAENSVITSCEANVTLDGTALTDEVGTTDRMYESGDQGEEENAEEPAA